MLSTESPEPPKPPKPSWRLVDYPPLNSTPLFRHQFSRSLLRVPPQSVELGRRTDSLSFTNPASFLSCTDALHCSAVARKWQRSGGNWRMSESHAIKKKPSEVCRINWCFLPFSFFFQKRGALSPWFHENIPPRRACRSFSVNSLVFFFLGNLAGILAGIWRDFLRTH